MTDSKTSALVLRNAVSSVTDLIQELEVTKRLYQEDAIAQSYVESTLQVLINDLELAVNKLKKI